MPSSTRKFLTFEQMGDAAQAVAVLLPNAAVAGGYAMQVHGSDRFTTDLDVLANRISNKMTRLGTLSFGGMQTMVLGVPVDVIVRNDGYRRLYAHALKTAMPHRGLPLRVVTKPALAAIKLQAGRISDLMFLLGIMSSSEIKTAHSIAKQFVGGIFASEELSSFVEEARWLKSRGRESRDAIHHGARRRRLRA